MLGSCQKALHRHTHTDTRAEKELSIFALVSPPSPGVPAVSHQAEPRDEAQENPKTARITCKNPLLRFGVIRILMTYFLGLPFAARQLAVGESSVWDRVPHVPWFLSGLGSVLRPSQGQQTNTSSESRLPEDFIPPSHSMKLSFIIFLNYIPRVTLKGVPQAKRAYADLRLI